jgi:hypothetical protein
VTPLSLGIFASANTTVGTSFESIATVSVGAGGASSVTFSSIPSTFTHLQIRGISRTVNAANDYRNGRIEFNSDSNTNYSTHVLRGDGSAASTDAGVSNAFSYPYVSVDDSTTASTYAGFVIDILDYANTNKFKTVRALSGADYNGAGVINFASGLWRSTSAITSIKLDNFSSVNWKQNSHFALYGIRSA